MLVNTPTFVALVISTIMCFALLFFIRKNTKKNQLRNIFIFNFTNMLICCIGLLLQVTLSPRLNINPIYFDYIVYIGTCLLPVSLFLTGLIFANTKIKFKKAHLLLFVIPILTLIILWTNDFHHLFYEHYSTNINECVYGSYTFIYLAYSYILYFLALLNMVRYTIKNSGFFSKQSILIVLGSSLPILVNILGVLDIIEISIYITPISFAFTLLFFAIAIFKFKFLNIAPIALQRIVDRMSDSYIVLNEDNVIIDFNEPFLATFKQNSSIRNANFFELIKKQKSFTIDLEVLSDAINKAKISPRTQHLEKHFANINKYFNIEISSILSKGNYLGTLILLKDITQHITDMKTIEENQDLLVEKERLASLGQMIGGIAHNLKTPIMSIAGACQGILDLVNEYQTSVGDPDVTVEDHKEIAKDMQEWVSKIKTHTEYMSDVITAVKGQAVALSNEEHESFTVDELIKYVNVLMRHELKNALVTLDVSMNTDNKLVLHGNINSLVQVINNIISNAIQAYEDPSNQKIDLIVNKENNNVVFSIRDYGVGISPKVQDRLFKEMVTTKGKNGTGLGLFMSYSNIRAHFNGNMTFESTLGKGTTFNIIIPVEE